MIVFGEFTVDVDRSVLLHAGVPVRLRSKTWDLLLYLIARPGALVTLDELYPVLWPDIVVGPQALAHLVWELRRALGDHRSPQRYIQTVTKRGYRFIGFETPLAGAAIDTVLPADPAEEAAEASSSARFIGRREEISILDRLWQAAVSGQRQIVLLAGEPGIGKTSLLEQFLRKLRVTGQRSLTPSTPVTPRALTPNPIPLTPIPLTPYLVVRGQCVLQQGAGEAYMPILEALGQLPAQAAIVDALRREAPTWLAQMPWLISAEEMLAVRTSLAGSGPSRMLREGMRLLNALTAISPLLLMIEDAHWADPATVDLLRLLAEAQEPARLLAVVTYRPLDIALGNHPLRATIAHMVRRVSAVRRIDLSPLSSSQVEAYLETHLPGVHWQPELFEHMERVSGGNPLFLRTLAEDLIERSLVQRQGDSWQLVEEGNDAALQLPVSLRNMVAELMSHLSQGERELLQAAAVVGTDLNARDVAAALQQDEEIVEMTLSDIADGGRLLHARSEVVWPDGSASSTFAFAHALYRDALYERIPARRRQQWHARIGDRLTSAAAGGPPMEVAAFAAFHYGAAAQWEKESRQLELATMNALRRYAFREARSYLQRVIASLQRLPESVERDRREAERQLDFANLTTLLVGFTDEGLDAAYDRILKLAHRPEDWQPEFRAQLGICLTAIMRADAAKAEQAAERLLAIAARHSEVAAAAHLYSAMVGLWLGNFRAALADTERGYVHLAIALPDVPRSLPLRHFLDVVRFTLLACLGELTEAGEISEQLTWDVGRGDNLESRALILGPLARAHLILGDHSRALAVAEEAIAVAEAHGLEIYTGVSRGVRAAVRCAADPTHLEELNAALTACRQRGELSSINYFRNDLAAAHWRRGEVDSALALLDANLLEENRGTDALGWCLRGEILGGAEGEACFDRALTAARRQQLKLAELHILTVRYRLRADQGAADQERQALLDAYLPFAAHGDNLFVRRAGDLLARKSPLSPH